MKIISKFKDYYDIGRSLGEDESIVYRRFPEIIDTTEYRGRKRQCASGRYDSFVYGIPLKNGPNFLHKVIIGFCGKVYKGYYIMSYDGGQNPRKECLYSKKDVMSYADQVAGFYRKELRDYELEYNSSFLKRWFLKYSTPLFVIDYFNIFHVNVRFPTHLKSELIINPYLEEYQFYKVFDPYTAFQEVAMYVGGVLQNKAPETVDISDEDLAEQKGFDEWSFKKLPTKKR